MLIFFKQKLDYVLKRSYASKDILILALCFLILNILVNLFNKYVLGLGYPHNTFLFIPEDRFADFFKIIDALHVAETWENGNPYEKTFNAYAVPFATTYYYFFAELILLLKNKYLVYGILIVSLLASHIFISKKTGNSYFTIILSIISYPVIYSIDRGNFALTVFILIFFGLTTNKIAVRSLAIALATSLKITPFIFIVPAIVSKPYSFKNLIASVSLFILFVVLINFLAVKVIEHQLTFTTFDFHAFSNMLSSYQSTYLVNMDGLPYGSSLYMALLFMAKKFSVNFLPTTSSIAIPFYVFSAIGFLLLLRDGRKISLYNYFNYEKNLFIISFSFVLFMPITADYYLLILLLPLLIFPKCNYSFGYFVIFGLLLGVKNIMFFHFTNISYQVLINPLLLLALLFAEFDLIPFIKRGALESIPKYDYKIITYIKNRTNTVALQLRPYAKLAGLLVMLFIIGSSLLYWKSRQDYKSWRDKHNLEYGLPLDFDPEIYLKLHPELVEFWESKGIKETKQNQLIHAGEHYKYFGVKDNWTYK
ncbi:MAG: hypothetical protein K2U26_04260 [Cyclobacteriaceae bacterium]|nr:hypothetical protein [Cyclobacteriaceae bacterium]